MKLGLRYQGENYIVYIDDYPNGTSALLVEPASRRPSPDWVYVDTRDVWDTLRNMLEGLHAVSLRV